MFAQLVLRAYRCAIQRANEAVSLSIFGGGHRSFGLEDGIDASHCTSEYESAMAQQRVRIMLASIGDLGGNFKENMVLDVPFGRSCTVHI
jgi:hypothetical protein